MYESLLILHNYQYDFVTPSLSDKFILPHPPTIYYPKKSKKKSRSGIATPNRHLFLLFFIFTFNLRSVQKHYQQCSILKNLDVVQCFQHEVRIHLRQRFCPIGVFYELLCSITFQCFCFLPVQKKRGRQASSHRPLIEC